jgi:hypothetical protein
MKRSILIIFSILLYFLPLKSQDLIHKKDGDILKCKITKIDSTNIYLELVSNNRHINTFIEKDRVDSIEYNVVKKKNPNIRSSSNDIVLFTFDPLGFITMGPSICSEILLQGKNSSVGFGIYTGIRITNLGLASNLLLSEGTMEMSYTVPLAARIYTKTRNKGDGFFIGPHVEFGKTHFKGGGLNKIRAFAGELGYKWVQKNGFTLEISDAIGVIQTKKIHTWDYIYNISQPEDPWQNLAFVPYMLSLKLGYTFHY